MTSFTSLIDQPFDLDSPYRSTVPFLAYWQNFDTRLSELSYAINRPMSEDVTLTFEYEVTPLNGKGNASQTDLMISSRSLAIATEAKYTEPKYKSVTKWLGPSPSANKLLVLEGWLNLINHAAGCALSVDLVKDITYQLFHRTASACKLNAEHRAVVYQYFDPIESLRGYYQEQIRSLARLVASPDRLSFYLSMTTLAKTTDYARLQAEWLRQTPRPNLADRVRELLKQQQVTRFSDPVFEAF